MVCFKMFIKTYRPFETDSCVYFQGYSLLLKTCFNKWAWEKSQESITRGLRTERASELLPVKCYPERDM